MTSLRTFQNEIDKISHLKRSVTEVPSIPETHEPPDPGKLDEDRLFDIDERAQVRMIIKLLLSEV